MLALLSCAAACMRMSSGPSNSASPASMSPDWLARSSPLAVEYLRTLPDTRIGQPLSGIGLPGGVRWLEGFVYLGRIETGHPGLNVVALRTPDEGPATLLWIDEDGAPFPLAVCPPEELGIRARVISGEVYTWKSLRPGDGVVSTECPPATWQRPAPEGPAPVLQEQGHGP
jgi:hypothetical protein